MLIIENSIYTKLCKSLRHVDIFIQKMVLSQLLYILLLCVIKKYHVQINVNNIGRFLYAQGVLQQSGMLHTEI